MCLCVCVCVCLSLSPVWLFVILWCSPTWLLCPWDFPGKNTGAGCHSLLQGIFPTQGLNPHLDPLHLLHWRRILYHLSYQGSPKASPGSYKTWIEDEACSSGPGESERTGDPGSYLEYVVLRVYSIQWAVYLSNLNVRKISVCLQVSPTHSHHPTSSWEVRTPVFLTGSHSCCVKLAFASAASVDQECQHLVNSTLAV